MKDAPHCPACGRPMIWRGDRWQSRGTAPRRLIEGDWACVVVHEPDCVSDPKVHSEPVAPSDPIKRSEPVD